ncbi:hypothetical protein Dfri01_59680 [Dyadobacter frigoris]|uniref:hypothetical protein n=1 Tax=Dyadobacter frigoris TaxID=2576211 RepID=UPI0024A005B0|nr:hypothetical protein [Dyadobacter frigoris]GLU56507.1 hypothetical protein Dfri01_59680 [Dyadobacter frigoris]
MKLKKYVLASLLFCSVTGGAYSQMITNDPIHTVITTIIKFFQEPSFVQLVGNVKKLVQISKFIRQVGRGVDLAKEATTTLKLINNYGSALAADKHILSNEYSVISKDFTAFGKEVAAITKDLAEVVQQKNSTMDDGSRLEGVNKAAERLRNLNAEIKSYVGKINYISQRRAFGADDKSATARLYKIASEVSGAGGSGFTGVDEFPGYTFGNDYNNEEVDFDVEKKMAQEAAMVQQQLYQEFNNKLQIAELEAQSTANLAIPKTTETGFYSIKIKEGACPMPPTPNGNGTFFGTTMHYDSTSGVTVTTQYEDRGKDDYKAAQKNWELQMEEVCGPLWEAYEKKVDMQRSMMVQAAVAPLRDQYTKEMNEKMAAAEAAIALKYKGQSTTKIQEQ